MAAENRSAEEGQEAAVRYEREYPEWPWKTWGGVEADKAKLEEAVHRGGAGEVVEGAGWDELGAV